MFTLENFINGINVALNICSEKENTDLILKRVYTDADGTERKKILVNIPIKDIEKIISELDIGFTFNDLKLLTNNSLEIAVKPINRMIYMPSILERLSTESPDHSYIFSLSKVSSKYLVAIICYSANNPECIIDFRSFSHSSVVLSSIEDLIDIFRPLTVKINCVKNHSEVELIRMLNSYLFNISYNNDITFSVFNFNENRRIITRKTRRNGQLFPYKSYNHELTEYYYQAISTDNPFTQFLAYYHVIEYFFQEISEQDALQEIVDFITRPSFNPYKKFEIKNFYKMIKKKISEQRDDNVWNEKNGLLLCLKKFIPNLDSLKISIERINPDIINYYENTKVEFANDSQIINFNDNEDIIYKSICNRVYSTRNSIVHSKESDKKRYEPSKHDKQLNKEIPLIRSIAEEIIVYNAKPLELV